MLLAQSRPEISGRMVTVRSCNENGQLIAVEIGFIGRVTHITWRPSEIVVFITNDFIRKEQEVVFDLSSLTARLGQCRTIRRSLRCYWPREPLMRGLPRDYR